MSEIVNHSVFLHWFGMTVIFDYELEITHADNGNDIDEEPTNPDCDVLKVSVCGDANGYIELTVDDFLIKMINNKICDHWCDRQSFEDFNTIDLEIR